MTYDSNQTLLSQLCKLLQIENHFKDILDSINNNHILDSVPFTYTKDHLTQWIEKWASKN